VFGSSSQAATQTAKKRWRLRPLIILAFLLFQALGVQPTADVLYAVVPSWDDPDTEDGDSITPLGAADIDKARGHTTLPSPSPRGSCRVSDIPFRDQNPTFSDVAARAPPVAHTSSLYVRSSSWPQFDLDLNDYASVRVPAAFTIVHAIDPRLRLIRWQVLRRAGPEAFETNSASAVCIRNCVPNEQKEEISFMFNRFFISTTILILLALSSLGCAGGDRSSRVSTLLDVTGTWEGSFSASGGQRSIRWVLQQNGAKVRGESHGPDGPHASIEGLVNGDVLDWTLTGPFFKFAGGQPLNNTYRGEATVNTDQLSSRAYGMYCPCIVVLRRVNTDAGREKKQ